MWRADKWKRRRRTQTWRGICFSVVCSFITALGVKEVSGGRPRENCVKGEWIRHRHSWWVTFTATGLMVLSCVLMCHSEEESLSPYVALSTAQFTTDWLYLCYLGCLAFFSSPKWSREFRLLGKVTGRRWEPASGSSGGGGGGERKKRERKRLLVQLCFCCTSSALVLIKNSLFTLQKCFYINESSQVFITYVLSRTEV